MVFRILSQDNKKPASMSGFFFNYLVPKKASPQTCSAGKPPSGCVDVKAQSSLAQLQILEEL